MLYCSSGVEHVCLKVCVYMCLCVYAASLYYINEPQFDWFLSSVFRADHCMIRGPPYSNSNLTLCWRLASFFEIEVLYTASILLDVCQ